MAKIPIEQEQHPSYNEYTNVQTVKTITLDTNDWIAEFATIPVEGYVTIYLESQSQELTGYLNVRYISSAPIGQMAAFSLPRYNGESGMTFWANANTTIQVNVKKTSGNNAATAKVQIRSR